MHYYVLCDSVPIMLKIDVTIGKRIIKFLQALARVTYSNSVMIVFIRKALLKSCLVLLWKLRNMYIIPFINEYNISEISYVCFNYNNVLS